jgi:hypothetical protein
MESALADLQHYLDDAVRRIRLAVADGRLSPARGADLAADAVEMARRSHAVLRAAWSTA